MSILLTNETSAAPQRASLGRQLFGEISRRIAGLVSGRAYRCAEADLMALSDRMLKDIGLDRSEIASALMDHSRERRNGARGQPW